MQPLASVLILSYNSQETIIECLKSVISQRTTFPFEILVYDDASTDASQPLIQDFCSKYSTPGRELKPVLSSKRMFGSDVCLRSRLLSITRGQYIAYCDGDDAWGNPEKLEIQITFLENHCEYVLSFHDVQKINLAGDVISTKYLPPFLQRDFSSNELASFKYQHILFGSLVHKKVSIDLPVEYRVCVNKDNFFPALLSRHGAAKYQAEAGPLFYRQTTGHFTTRPDIERFSQDLRTRLLIGSYLLNNGNYGLAAETLNNEVLAMLNLWNSIYRESKPGSPKT